MPNKSIGLLIVTLLLLNCTSQTRTGLIEDPVRVEQGLVSGIASPDSLVKSYKGIPYAAPPVGDLRWRPPQPPASWDSVRASDRFPASCIQNKAGSRPPWTEEFMVQNEISEDCLYLNVWTPASRAESRLPVLVYIHGGGFSEGSGSIDIYDGANLAAKGLVVVTLNYRLGALGFLAHPDLTRESERNASGNYGLLDQLAALRWIRNNIEAFGGDPGRVTIAGQSAGAISVYALTASPLAEGLFHRAIIQSGPGALASFGLVSTSGLAQDLEMAEQNGVKFSENRQASSIEELRSMTVEQLMNASGDEQAGRFGPVVDGWFLPQPIDEIYRLGQQNDVPTISGMNADESSAFPGYGSATPEEFEKQVRERYGELADKLLELYPYETAGEAGQSEIALTRDLGVAAMRKIAAERAETAATGHYLYYFSRGIPWPEYPDFDAFHTAEVPYVFDNLEKLDRPWEPVDKNIAESISSYWVNFVANGNPQGSGLPRWPPYEEDSVRFMVFADSIGAQRLLDGSKAELFRKYLEREPDVNSD